MIWEFTCKNCSCSDLIVIRYYEIIAGNERECWQEWGLLEEDHHWSYEEEDLLESIPQDEYTEGRELDIDSVEFFVNCADCDREIEFGWSHPDRMGRIWPAECSDFNPWKSWPEPRYRDSWRLKGWLRPGTE